MRILRIDLFVNSELYQVSMANEQAVFEREKELCELFRKKEEKKVFT